MKAKEVERIVSQLIFNKTVRHLAKQGKQSIAEYNDLGNRCAYRGEDDMSCAVGCHITDREYNDKMEGSSVFGLVDAGLLPARLVPYHSLLGELQICHDDASDICDTLSVIADHFDLSPSVIAEEFSKLCQFKTGC